MLKMSQRIKRITNGKINGLLNTQIRHKSEKLFASSSILDNFKQTSDIPPVMPVNKEIGLHSYIKKVGLATGQNLGITAVTGGIALGLFSTFPEFTTSVGLIPWIGAACTGIFSCYKVATIEPKYEIDENKNPIITNPPDRILWSNILFGCQGIVIAPSLILFTPYIPAALITTGAVTAGAISTSLYLPKGSMLKWGPALYTSLWGLLGCGVVGIFIPAFHTINLYGGVGIFTLYNIYDTHKVIDDYSNGKIDYLSHSIDYSLNFINIFIRMLEIMARANKNK